MEKSVLNLPLRFPSPARSTLPVVLAYPRIYERLLSPRCEREFDRVLAKCSELAVNPPQNEDGRKHRGFLDLGELYQGGMLGLYTLWSDTPVKPDIFIIFGAGDGSGPGHSCPGIEALQSGKYGTLQVVSFV